jgi:hypothetical protein
MNNFFIAEIGVMVLATGAAVFAGIGTPLVLGCIVFLYCAVYLGLNYAAAARLGPGRREPALA